MKAFKGFNNDLTCRDYKFIPGKKYVEEEANCKQNGFHSAEDPLDCLTYYPQWDTSVYYVVEASGDINEDDHDSKISSTEITLIKKLSLSDFLLESMLYMINHPHRQWNRYVKPNKAMANSSDKFVIVRGKNPIAAAQKEGTIIAILKENEKSSLIESINLLLVDEKNVNTNTWYTVEGHIAGKVGDNN